MSVNLNLGNLLLTVYNIDETGVSTVVQSPNIVADRDETGWTSCLW